MGTPGPQVMGGGSPNPNMIGINSPAGMSQVMAPGGMNPGMNPGMTAPGYGQQPPQAMGNNPQGQGGQ